MTVGRISSVVARLEAYASSRGKSGYITLASGAGSYFATVDMARNMNNYSTTFTQYTKDAFDLYLQQNPNKRRVSLAEKENMIEWLTSRQKRPSTQEEFSRRHYIRKTFSWNQSTNTLFTIAKKGVGRRKIVVTENNITEVVEMVHNNNGHTGWDATWKSVNNAYYGILRADVIVLLKNCQICLHDPRKQPKGSATAIPNIQFADEDDSLFDLNAPFHLPNMSEDQCSPEA